MSEPPSPPDPDDRSAPEGATCSEHEERPALARCPLCGRDACITCWHAAADRCERCLAADRAAAAPPIPWETDANVVSRFFGTLRAALSPVRTAPAFAGNDTRRAWTFALLTTLPLALLSGVIPYTFTLRFGPSFAVELMHRPGAGDIALDVARAAGLGALIQLGQLVALGVSYVSLSRAFGEEREIGAAPQRGVLYRSFLLPLAGLDGVLASLTAWAAPTGFMGTEDAPGTGAYFLPFLLLLPFALYFTGLRQTARLATGLRPLPSFVVTIIPFVVMVLVGALAHSLLAPLMPGPMPAAS